MNCGRAVKSIAGFLNDELDTDELKAFLEHIDSCPQCREELTIEILVQEGLNSLESGENFDIDAEYSHCIYEARHNLSRREALHAFYLAMTGLVGVALVSVIALIIIL